MNIDELRFPIGAFSAPDLTTAAQVKSWIDEIEGFPDALRAVVEPMTPEQLDTPYRPEGWTVKQVVHHLPDSHLNSYIRFKWALTEDHPEIKMYFEARWAKLRDYADEPISVSLSLLEALHRRWVDFLRGLTPDDLARTFLHPELGVVRLDTNIGIYAWHGRHHLAHITRLAEREGWSS